MSGVQRKTLYHVTMIIFLLAILSCGGCITQADLSFTETIYIDAPTVIIINNTPVLLFESPPKNAINPIFIDNILYFELSSQE